MKYYQELTQLLGHCTAHIPSCEGDNLKDQDKDYYKWPDGRSVAEDVSLGQIQAGISRLSIHL